MAGALPGPRAPLQRADRASMDRGVYSVISALGPANNAPHARRHKRVARRGAERKAGAPMSSIAEPWRLPGEAPRLTVRPLAGVSLTLRAGDPHECRR